MEQRDDAIVEGREMLGWEKVADSANTESIKGSNDYAKKRSLRQKLPRISGKEKPLRYNCVILLGSPSPHPFG